MLWTEGLGTFARGIDPWTQLQRIENEMNRVLSRYASPSTSEFPAVNIWVDGDIAMVTTEVPGIDSDKIDISVIGRTLVIRGTRVPETIQEGESYHRRERWYGEFAKSVELPFQVSPDKVEAKFSKGVLAITLPRAEADKPKKITVRPA